MLVGPGLDAPEPAEQLLRDVLDGIDGDARLVLDAFALGVLPQLDADRVAGRARC